MQKTNRLKGKKVIIMDDLLATGGTFNVRKRTNRITGCISLWMRCCCRAHFLRGSELLECPVVSLASYEE